MKQPWKRYIKVVANLLIALLGILAVLWLAPKIILFFMPFIIGWLLAAIANPLVRFFDEKLKITRKAGSVIVIVAVIAAIIAVGYLVIAKLVEELSGFAADLPELIGALQADLNRISGNLTVFLHKLPFGEQLKVSDFGGQVGEYFGGLLERLESPTFEAVGSLASKVPAGIISVIMCLLSAYFFVADRENVSRFIKKHIPLPLLEKWSLVYGTLGHAVGGYFKAQFRIEIWIYLLMVMGFSLLKIKYALLIALGIAILDFLPVFGTGAVLIPWAVIKVLSADYKMAIWLLIIWCGGQLVRQIIQPKIVGDSIGLAPLPTLFLLFIGYKLGGVLGMIIAVPLGIILVNMDEEGIFDTAKDSIRILWYGLERFRRLDEEDMAPVKAEQERLRQELREREAQQSGEKQAARPGEKNQGEGKQAARPREKNQGEGKQAARPGEKN